MLNRRVLKEIATRLNSSGDCPHDPSCPFAAADGCFASGDALEEKLSRIRADIEREIDEEITAGKIWGWFFMGCGNTSKEYSRPWPCNEGVIIFVDPD